MNARTYFPFAMILGGALCATLVAAAPHGPDPDERTPCSTKAANLPAAAQQTVAGEVKDVLVEATCMGERNVLQIKIKSEGKDYLVYLGPNEWIKAQHLAFAVGDLVVVQGQVVDVDGQLTIVASSVQKGERQLRLRNAGGDVAWGTKKAPTEARETGHDEF